MADQGDWRSEAFRRKVITQIEEALRSSNTPMTKSSQEMENHVYHKAKSREEYLALVARLILHVKDFNNQRREKALQQQQQQQQTGMPGPGGMVQGPGAGGMVQGPGGMGSQIATGSGGMVQGPGGMVQGPGGGSMVQGPGGGGMVQGPGGGGMVQGPGGVDPINALQNMTMSGAGMGPGVQQPGMMGGNPQQQMQSIQQRQQMMQQLQAQRMASQQPRPSLQRQDAFIVTSSQPQQQVSSVQQATAPSGGQMSQQFTSGNVAGMSRPSQFGLVNQASPQVNSNPPSQGTAPSPAQPSSQQQQPAGSPMSMMTSPSPYIAPSPTPRTTMSVPSPSTALNTPGKSSMMTSPSPYIAPSPTPRTTMSVPSPSTALNTPGNPGSVGASPSPASQVADEQAYLEKLKQLSKYIEPLRRMIKKSEDGKESDHRKNDINKLKNLHDILSNPNKRVPMATLAKCEQVLEKIHFGSKISSSAVSAPPHAPYVHMCQPLLDSFARHMTSATFNHTLQKTFGPAMAAMFGSPIRAPSPPTKRRKLEEPSRIPDILQGEIARLDRRFKVKLDPIQHTHSQDVHLICRLDDERLPSVPPILVKIPHGYPDNSPECTTSHKDYESTPFLRSIQQVLVTHLLDLPSLFSFTALLDMWEMSVRKACVPNK